MLLRALTLEAICGVKVIKLFATNIQIAHGLTGHAPRVQLSSITYRRKNVNMCWPIVVLFIILGFDTDLSRSGCRPSIICWFPREALLGGQSWGWRQCPGQRQELLQLRRPWVFAIKALHLWGTAEVAATLEVGSWRLSMLRRLEPGSMGCPDSGH